MVQDKNAQKIVVLTHNPKGEWGDVRPKIEADNGYKGWGTSFNLELNQCVVIYISSDVRQYRYVMKVVKTYKGYIDLELVCKIDSKDSELLSYEKLKEHGLKPSTVNYTLSNNRNKELYLYVMKILEKSIAGQCNSHETSFISHDIEKSALNQILYGPPGTGKTYHTIDKALQIIDGEVPNDREKAKARFEELKEVGQVEFVTFHQSYGYEEFVEGIKADVKSDDIRYTIEDGIFKKLSTEALFESILFDNFQEDLTYTELYNVVLEKYKREQILRLKSKDGKTIEIRDISQKDNLHCYHEGSDVRHTVGKNRLKKLYDEYNNIDKLNKLSGIHEEFTRIIGGANQTVYWTVLNEILKNKEDIKKENIDEEITYTKKKELVNENLHKKYKIQSKNYLLIIDEINRGNISKIFGELITLIEESKRLGNDEAMEVTLPYSGELFGIPKNFYIIGTMNTADRSIALMDTALRRRFEFIEMMPDYDVTREEVGDNGMIDGIDIASMLEKINKRIEYLYDRDHTIGHAYFLKAKDKLSLDSVMRNQVIPLLQEYFYDDWEKIQIVLGDHEGQGKEEHDKFVRSIQNNEKDIFGFNYDELDELEYSYSINETFTDEAYLGIYA